jgi:hypothetical protein
MVEVQARVLLLLDNLLRGLLINWLSILNWGSLDWSLDWSLLLRGTVAASATHDTSDGLVSNFRASTHGHTGG